jgi:hypothetical protein
MMRCDQRAANHRSQSAMKRFIPLLTLLTITNAFAQDDLSKLNDEFKSSESLKSWNQSHEREQIPSKIHKLTIENDNLILEPGISGWFQELQAPFVFKEVSGDFDVTARIKLTGLETEVPSAPWSLGGLMVRASRQTRGADWQPKEENWMFMTTGVAEEPGKIITESKFTANSRSSLKLRASKSGWITIRLVRSGYSFVYLYKFDGDKTWTVRERFYHMNMPMTLEVGVVAYTNALSVGNKIYFTEPKTFNNNTFEQYKGDARLTVDYIRFKRPKVNFTSAGSNYWLDNVSKNNLTDYSITNEQLVKMLGE